MTIRVVSINIWGGRVYDTLMEYLPQVNADVYCLQEVYNAPVPLPEWLTFEVIFREPEAPVRPNLFQEIANILPEHRGFYYPAARGFLHDGAPVETPVEYGIATFVRKSIPIIGEHMGFVYSQFRHYGWGDPPLSRNAHAIRILDYETESPVVIAHMHGLWQKSGKEDSGIRDHQSILFAHTIENVMGVGDCIIACGDWNLLPESSTFGFLRDHLGLRDLVTGRGFTDTRTSYYKKNPRYADYMCVSSGVKVKHFDVVADPEVSDHRPLLLEFN